MVLFLLLVVRAATEDQAGTSLKRINLPMTTKAATNDKEVSM
jgi:hypothetical protein